MAASSGLSLISIQVACFPVESSAGLFFPHHTNKARKRTERAIEEQVQSAKAIRSQIEEAVSDPAIRGEIKRALDKRKTGTHADLRKCPFLLNLTPDVDPKPEVHSAGTTQRRPLSV